jgi:hypothetical protein
MVELPAKNDDALPACSHAMSAPVLDNPLGPCSAECSCGMDGSHCASDSGIVHEVA